MLYAVKFLYHWFLPPASVILLLLCLNIYMWRHRSAGRKFLSIIIILFYIMSLRLGARMLACPLENYYKQPQLGEVGGDVIILLGGGAIGGVPDFDGKGQPLPILASGILFVARLQRRTGLPVVVSGGAVYQDSGSEADITVRNLRALGIPNNLLWAENRSRSTAENARLCKELCAVRGWKKPILLTAALHSPRANILFRREGLACQPYPTHYRLGKNWHFNPNLDLLPDAYWLEVSAAALKEYMGIGAAKLGL